MRTRVLAAAVLGLAAVVVHAATVGLNRLAEPRQAPDFSLQDRQGQTHTLADYKGKVVIFNFWATWCAPCVKEMPSMQRAWEQTRDQGVVLLAINWGDDAEAVDVFFEKRMKTPVDFPVLLGGDRAMTSAWGVRGLPTTFVINPEGAIVFEVVGEREWDDPELLQQVLALTEG